MLDEDIHLCLEYLQCKSIECLYLRSTTLSLFYTYIDIITEIITYDRRSAVSDKLVHDRVHVINRKVTIPVKPSLATPVTVPVSYKEKPPKAIVGSKHANIESTDPEFIPMEVGTIRRKVCHNVDKINAMQKVSQVHLLPIKKVSYAYLPTNKIFQTTIFLLATVV